MALPMFLLYSLLQNCHTWLYLCFFYKVYFKTVTHDCICFFYTIYFKTVTHDCICFFYTIYFKTVTLVCIYVSSIQSTSKLSPIAVSTFLLYNLLQNCHTWLYLCFFYSLLQTCNAWLYLCFFYTVYFKTVTHGCIYVSSIQSTSKLSHMAVSMFK